MTRQKRDGSRASKISPYLFALLMSCGSPDQLSPLRVTMLYPVSGKNDGGLGDQMFEGLAAAKLGVDSEFDYEEYTPADEAEARELLDSALVPRQGRRLVIAGGDIYSAALADRACDFGAAQVLQLQATPDTCPTLRSLELRSYIPAFLAGVMAVSAESLAPRRAAGVIASGPSPNSDEIVEAFVAGVDYARGTSQVLYFDSLELDALDNPTAARRMARQVASEVDVLLVVGGGSSENILEEVRLYNADNPEQPVRLIGVDHDLSVNDANVTLGSILRRFDMEVRSSVVAAELGSFAAGQVVRGFGDAQSELYVNPAYEQTALGAVPFAGCEQCETLADAIAQAEPAASEAGADHYE